jgi:hypothetical protein
VWRPRACTLPRAADCGGPRGSRNVAHAHALASERVRPAAAALPRNAAGRCQARRGRRHTQVPFWKSSRGVLDDKPASQGGVDPTLAPRTARGGSGSLVLGQVRQPRAVCCVLRAACRVLWRALVVRAVPVGTWAQPGLRCRGRFSSIPTLRVPRSHEPPSPPPPSHTHAHTHTRACARAKPQDQDCPGGCFSPSNAYDGDLAVLRIWDRTLNSEEIKRNMMRERPESEIGMVRVCWRCRCCARAWEQRGARRRCAWRSQCCPDGGASEESAALAHAPSCTRTRTHACMPARTPARTQVGLYVFDRDGVRAAENGEPVATDRSSECCGGCVCVCECVCV